VRGLLAVIALLATPGLLCAQNAAPPAALAARTMTLTGGVGNAMGWFGAQGERYFAGDRLSAFAGVGYTPAIDPGDPAGLTLAGGVRGYTRGQRHRAFLELAVSQIAVTSGPAGERHYGPGAQVGYQYAARHGFTVAASVGVGYAASLPEIVTSSHVQPLLGLGFGYTWR
jgi:hypothetical protein